VQSAEDRLPALYDLRAGEEPQRDPEALLRFRKALRAAELHAGARVLDLGTKRGALAQVASELGMEIVYAGTELSPEKRRRSAGRRPRCPRG
jgi:cyclopropane fatty-acyl-phospholipid synthase-like methyltransferase